MTVIRGDLLSKYLHDNRHGERVDNWLWFRLLALNLPLDTNYFRSPGMRDEMARCLANSPVATENLLCLISQRIVSDDYWKWVNNDERLIAWLLFEVQARTGVILNDPRLLGRDLAVTIFDIWAADLGQKALTIKTIEHAWVQHTQQDYIFKWFKKEYEARRCELAWEWLRKNKPQLVFCTPTFKNHKNLLMFFDMSRLGEAEKIICVDQIKKRWSQQQYREKLVGKKQCNLILSDKSINILDKLAEAHSLKRAQILEILIQMEEEKAIYLPEKMRMIRRL